MAFAAPSVFHVFRPYSTFFALVNNLLWHLLPHLCSTFFTIIQPFSPLSTLYYSIWCPICVPPYSTFFALVNTLLWHLVPHLCFTFFILIHPCQHFIVVFVVPSV